MTQINSYITFNGTCRESMTFYKECFGGELNFQTIAGSPIESVCPPDMKESILHSTLIKDGNVLLMGSDMIGPGGYVAGNNVTLSINCISEAEITDLFGKLSAGGEILDPLKVQFWGAWFAVCNDKFGIKWMLNCEPSKQ